jgi:hypothetical protein
VWLNGINEYTETPRQIPVRDYWVGRSGAKETRFLRIFSKFPEWNFFKPLAWGGERFVNTYGNRA